MDHKVRGRISPEIRKPFRIAPGGWDCVAAVFVLFLLAWVVTDGDWDFFPHARSHEEYFDAQAQSLIHGRIDVPLRAIMAERFERNGKYYGYFGPTPSLPRIVLNTIMPGMYGRWSRFSMLLGSLAAMAALFLLFRQLENILHPGGRLWTLLRLTLIVALFLGSTNVFISTESKFYQESIIWASALAFTHAVFLLCYLIERRWKWLVLCCAAAFLSFNAKISSGAGPLAALLLLDTALLVPSARWREFWGVARQGAARREIVAITLTLVLSAASWAGLNYWKYGLVFTSQPLHLTPHPDPERLRRIKGDPFSLNNIPLTLSVYLNPANIQFANRFPWAFMVRLGPKVAAGFPNAHFDAIEELASLPASMPALFLAAIAGSALCFLPRRESLRRLRIPLCGTLAGGFLILGWGYITYRFLHDFIPWLALGAAIALAHVPRLRCRWIQTAAVTLFIVGTGYSVWVNLAFSAIHKRIDIWPESDVKRVAFLDLAQDITSRGLSGAWNNLTHWHGYLPAAQLHRGNVTSGNTVYTRRADISLIWYDGPPPGIAEYTFQPPAEGVYEMSLLYASAESRPLRLLVNGVQVMPSICGQPTGGMYVANQRWCSVGRFHMPAAQATFALLSDGKFPVVRMIRIVRTD